LRREPRRFEGPSVRGSCDVGVWKEDRCRREGRIRYFVAVPMPCSAYLCDYHYIEVRDALKEKLRELLIDLGVVLKEDE